MKRGILLVALFITLGLVSCREDVISPDETGIRTPSDADGCTSAVVVVGAADAVFLKASTFCA